MTSVLDNMKRLVQATVDGFNTWDYNALRATRSDDFIYQFLPTTLKAPPRNNEDYGEFFKTQLTPLFTKFVVSAHLFILVLTTTDIFEDPLTLAGQTQNSQPRFRSETQRDVRRCRRGQHRWREDD